ncbi:MAG: TatD family hydrolase [Clostridia bacterium]|nr:TatD family hydrolase [Clostridia bacterium]
MFDSHAHYDDSKFDGDRDEKIKEIFSLGVTGIVNASSDIPSSIASIKLAEKYDGIYACVGVHPHEAEKAPSCYLDILKPMFDNKKVVALGEIGLDYHYDFSPRDIQKKIFHEQLEFAEQLDVPVVIHDREAHKDCIDAVLQHKNVRGVFHSFSGSAESAAILQKAGWYVSISGVVTFKNAEKTVLAAKSVSDDRLLVETDCPYLAPHPCRGERNNSYLMRHTIQKLADIRGTTFEYIEKITTENAKRFYGIER